MRRIIVFFLLLAAACQAAEPSIREGSVVVLPIKGEINDAQFFFLRRILKDAESEKAAAIILDMNTPGGSLSSTQDIVQALLKSKIPIYTYVNTNAASAGALIALATKFIYMAPVSAIGAAAPVLVGGQEIPKTMDAKVVSFYSGYFRSVAEQSGYNPNLVDAFMDLKKEVKIGDKVLNSEGSVLTLSAGEATQLYDGKPLLAKGVAPDLASLLRQAGLSADAVVKIKPSGFEMLAKWITMFAPLLLAAGLIAAWMEFKTPGFGIAGIVSVVCFTLYFTGHYLAGLTGFEVVGVFVLGLILILLELFFFPGTVVLAILGIGLMMGSLLFAMVDYYPGQPFVFSLDTLIGPLINLGVSLLLFMIAVAVLARFLPDLPIFSRLVLRKAAAEGPALDQPEAELYPVRVQVGDIGTARTTLRPAGRADFGDSVVDVVSDGEFVEPGARLVVLEVRGEQVVVGKAARGETARQGG